MLVGKGTESELTRFTHQLQANLIIKHEKVLHKWKPPNTYICCTFVHNLFSDTEGPLITKIDSENRKLLCT